MPIELTSYGDKELHLAKGKTLDGEWIIPVYVIYYRSDKQEFCKVAPAVGLGAEQAGYLFYHFNVYNQWKRSDVFLINREHLGQLVEKASGVTPAFYYRWPGVPLPPREGVALRVSEEDIVEEIPKETESFLKWVSKRRSIKVDVLRLAWSAIAQEAAEWLLKKKKPINLGFVTLHAFPYRANWKEILLASFPNAYWWFFHNLKRPGGFEERCTEAELINQLVGLEMMALHGTKHHIWWSIEAVPTKEWEKEVTEIELTRKAGGETDYVKLYEKTVADLAPRILEVFAAYVEKVARPFPEIRSGSWPGSQKLVPYRGPRKVLPRTGETIQCRIMVDTGPPKIRTKQFDKLVIVRPKIGNGVQTVSPLLQATNDVRESTEPGDVGKPENGEGGAVGLLLSDAAKGENEGQQVLPEPENERANGLDI